MYDISGEVSNAEDFDITFEITDTSGVALDLDDYDIEFQLGTLEGTKSSGHVTIPTLGQFRVRFYAPKDTVFGLFDQFVAHFPRYSDDYLVLASLRPRFAFRYPLRFASKLVDLVAITALGQGVLDIG